MKHTNIFVTLIKIVIFLVLVALLYTGIQHFWHPKTTAPLTGDLNYGLNDATSNPLAVDAATEEVKGFLYFDLVTTNTETNQEDIGIYMYNLQNDIPTPVFSTPNTAFDITPVSPNFVTIISALADTQNDVYSVPIWLNTHSLKYGVLQFIEGYLPHRIVPSPDEQWAAISFQKEDIPENTKKIDLDNWEVVLKNPNTKKEKIIKNASSPQWLNDGKDLLYVKKDGIYRYNLQADASERIIKKYQKLDAGVTFAVSPVSDALVLTLPAAHTMAIFTSEDPLNAKFTEIGRIQDPNTIYITPVFAPYGQQYAVVARTEDGQNSIEIRTIYTRESIKHITPDTIHVTNTAPLYLSAWSDIPLNQITVPDNPDVVHN